MATKKRQGNDEPRVVDVWERLVRFQRLTLEVMDERLRRTFGHSLDDYDVLHQLAEHDSALRMGDLAERLLVANSSCNRIVGRLVESGDVRRLAGERDRREVLAELTDAGRRLHRRMAAAHGRDINQLVGQPLDRQSLAALDRASRQLLAGHDPSSPVKP